ncbi:hypothetical protein GCM10009613_61410 [Pseudonocardia kongjuensis]|uniref:Right handed beta helix domain-containing protein n=1 Tax=Pseudonocardia kongjuensis TaxID=102227 RepID=A0ABP4IYF0_9PSEU
MPQETRLEAVLTAIGQGVKALREGKADDSTVVHRTGNETVNGTKTFGSSPVIPNPSAPAHPVRNDDPRNSNPRAPTSHAGSHGPGGSDPLTPDAIGAATRPVRTQAELVAALAAGGDVYVDSSVTIALSSTMTISKPTRLIGGTFTRTSGEAFRITSSSVEITGATITGGAGTANSYDSTQKLIRAVGTSTARLTGIDIHDNAILQCRGDCVWLEWCEGARVASNTVRRFLYSGVMVISGLRCRVSDNEISDGPLTSGVVNVYGIAFTDTDNTLAARSTDCIAIGNTVHQVDWEGIDTHGGDSILVTGNIITGCPRGIALIGGNASRVAQSIRCQAIGNRIDGSGARQTLREGIIAAGMSGKPTDVVIVGNTIDNYSTPIMLDFWDRGISRIGSNNIAHVPWTNITLDGDYNANGTYPPQYRVDNGVVHLRGGVIPKSSSVRTKIGTIPNAAAWPSILQFIGYAKGSNAGAGNAMIGVDPAGVLSMYYMTGTDTFTYFLSGSYSAP